MNVKRYQSFCTVFQGQCVVLGGTCNYYSKIFKTVESYDHYLDKWSFLPDMQIARLEAGVVSKGNKLFVICGHGLYYKFLETCEVYDSISQKFFFIKSNSKIISSSNLFCTYFKENNFIVIYDNRYRIYNIDTNSWSEYNVFEFDKLIYDYSCVELGKLIN